MVLYIYTVWKKTASFTLVYEKNKNFKNLYRRSV